MMKLATNLVFNGQCQEAFERYAEIFNGKIVAMMPFSSAPEGSCAESFRQGGGIMHAWLDIGDQAIMGCDNPTGQSAEMGGFSVSFHTADMEEARRVFDALADSGKIAAPFGPMFFSPGFGMLTDRFGTPWIVNTKPELPH